MINKNELDNFAGLDNFHLPACLFSSCLSREGSCQPLCQCVGRRGSAPDEPQSAAWEHREGQQARENTSWDLTE